MGREHLELRVIGVMVVTEKEYFRALGKLLLQQALNIRNYAPSPLPAIQRITLLQKAPEHIRN
jgi:hypothetical protein